MDLVDQVLQDQVAPYLVVASFVASLLVGDPSSFWGHDFVENVAGVVDVADVADEEALVVDADVDYEVAGFDFAEEQVLVLSCIGIQIDLMLALLEMLQPDSDHVILSSVTFPYKFSCFVLILMKLHKNLWIAHLLCFQKI